VPVIFGVVTTDTMQQALERSGIKSNLGWNYAMSALEMGTLMRQVKGLATSSYDQLPVASAVQVLSGETNRAIAPDVYSQEMP
jgi:6,7-dimethyl-8-ribityllumazine synthase